MLETVSIPKLPVSSPLAYHNNIPTAQLFERNGRRIQSLSKQNPVKPADLDKIGDLHVNSLAASQRRRTSADALARYCLVPAEKGAAREVGFRMKIVDLLVFTTGLEMLLRAG